MYGIPLGIFVLWGLLIVFPISTVEHFMEVNETIAYGVVPLLMLLVMFFIGKIIDNVMPEKIPRYGGVRDDVPGRRLDDLLIYLLGGPVKFALILGAALILCVYFLIYWTTGSIF